MVVTVVSHLDQQISRLATAEIPVTGVVMRLDQIIENVWLVLETDAVAHHLEKLSEFFFRRVDNFDLIGNTTQESLVT